MQIQGSMLNIKNRTRDGAAIMWNTQNAQDENKTSNRKTIFIGNTGNQDNALVQKKKEAQEKAMKVVKDAFAREIEIDHGIEASKDKISDNKDVIKEAQDQIKALEEEKAFIKENCTEEEYQQISAEYAKQEQEFCNQIADANKNIREENASIRQVNLDRLKSQNMQDAINEADEIMDAAGKELMRDALQQMQDHIDEKREEEEKKSEEKAEEEEKEEKRMHQPVSETRAVTETILTYDQISTKTSCEIRNILEEYKLTEEDIKGVAVDSVR